MCSVIVSVCSDNGICTVPMDSEADRKPYCVCDEQWIGPGCQFARPRSGGGDPHLQTLDGMLNPWCRKVVSHVVLQVANSVQLDYEFVREIPVAIVASLTQPVLRTSETIAVISLSDVNDNSPMFSKEVYTVLHRTLLSDCLAVSASSTPVQSTPIQVKFFR